VYCLESLTGQPAGAVGRDVGDQQDMPADGDGAKYLMVENGSREGRCGQI